MTVLTLLSLLYDQTGHPVENVDFCITMYADFVTYAYHVIVRNIVLLS